MLIEMHCHSAEHSPCSSVAAVELVQQVYAKGLQGMVLTDHHYLWPEADLAELRRQSGVPESFLLASGQETNVPVFGDVLVYGARAALPRGTPLEEIRGRFPEAAVVWAHPYRDGRQPSSELLGSPLLNGIEIFNSNHTVQGNSRGLQDWRRLGFTATAGTDTHAASYAGIYPTLFDGALRTLDDLVLGIRGGRCRPFFKEIPHREASKVTEVTIGTGADQATRQGVIIRTPPDAAGWSKAERAYHIMSAIAGHGFDRGLYRVPRPVEKYRAEGVLVEEAVGGVSLYDKLLAVPPAEAREYFRMAARWLARMHGLSLRITTVEEFLAEERRRLEGELRRFNKANHPYSAKTAEIVEAVKAAEQELALLSPGSFVQGHGDYHPKNIRVAQDDPGDPGTLYLAAIDFERSQLMPPAFDVGWFLAQFRSQFAGHPQLRATLDEELFIQSYLGEATAPHPPDFLREVELFRARTNISIAAFLIKLNLGDSRELWRILVEAERALTYLA